MGEDICNIYDEQRARLHKECIIINIKKSRKIDKRMNSHLTEGETQRANKYTEISTSDQNKITFTCASLTRN